MKSLPIVSILIFFICIACGLNNLVMGMRLYKQDAEAIKVYLYITTGIGCMLIGLAALAISIGEYLHL